MHLDAIIVGGGPAGAACARVLANGGAKCALVDRPPSGRKVGEVIDSSVRVPLEQLGLWEAFQSRNHLRCAGTISLWGNDVVERTAMVDPFGGGVFVDRPDFDRFLLENAETAGALVLRDSRATRICREGPLWQVNALTRRHATALSAPLLIDAGGRGRSSVRVGAIQRMDSLVALVGYQQIDASFQDRRMMIESMPDGWWYVAPLPEQVMVIAFLTDADLLPTGKAERAAFFRAQISQSSLVKFRVDSSKIPKELRTIRAMSMIREKISGDRWLAVGDSAAAYDPLAGLGVATALSKGAAVGRLVGQRSFDTARHSYEEAERDSFENYLKMRKAIYRLETRWPTSKFWRRRR